MSGTSEERKARQKARYEYLKARGRCVQCAQPAFAGRTMCAECLYKLTLRNISHTLSEDQKVQVNKAHRESYWARKAAGLCVTCGKPAVQGRVRCMECLLKNRLDKQAHLQKKRAEKPEEPEKPPRIYTPPMHRQGPDHPWNRDNRLVFQALRKR